MSRDRLAAFEARMTDLIEIAKEEGVVPSSESAKALRRFVATFGAPDAVFLLDEGIYRGRWIVEGQSTSLAFELGGAIKAIHIPLPAVKP